MVKKSIKSLIHLASEKLNDLFNSKKLFVFFGDNGTYIAVYKNLKLVNSIFIEGEEYDINKYHESLSKYKAHQAYIIVDKQLSELHHSQILVAQSLLPVDYIGKFISKNIDEDHIVASNVFDTVTDETNETWHTVLMSIKETQVLSDLVSYLVTNFVNFKGLYFLSLNVPNIINSISSDSQVQVKSKLQIFVTLTSFSGVRILVCQDQNVMESHYVTFPHDKSLEYVQGVIEQAVSDCVISLKNYIHHHQQKPSLILLAPKEIHFLLTQSKFDVGEVIIYRTESKNHFNDEDIGYFLNKKIEFKASNEELKSYSKAVNFNKLFFKPLWIIFLAFIYILGQNEININRNYHKASKANEKYYNVSEEYRKQREQYPYIDAFGSIVDFHSAMAALSIPQKLPFDTLNKLFGIVPPNFNLQSIHWDDVNNDIIKINAKYLIKTSDLNSALTSLENDIIILKKDLESSFVDVVKNDTAIMNHGGYVSIPVRITISNGGK